MPEITPHEPKPELLAAGRRLDVVDDRLAVGGAPVLDDPAALSAAGVTHVIDLREPAEFDDAGAALDARLATHGIARLNRPVANFTAPSDDDLAAAESWLAEQPNEGRVFVHCQLGLGRGAVMAIALLVRRGFPVDEAIERVRTVRPEIKIGDAQREWLSSLAAA